MDAPVARPALLVLLVTERELLAVADGGHPIGRDSLSGKVVLDRLRALGAEGEVVLDGAAAVGMALELDLGARVLAQPPEIAREDVARRGVELVAVEPEVHVAEDAVLLGT